MTVSSQTPINRSTGNGVTTVFPYGFKIISEADIEVTVDGVAKTLNVDYTVSGVGNEAGGNVTMTAAPANLAIVVRRRNMALVRTTDYQDQGEMPAETLDSDFDSAVLMIQQVDEQIGRAVTVPAGVTGFDGQLPDPVSSMFLRINSAGDGFDLVSEVTPGALTVTPFIETLLNDTDATAARATLGAQVAGSYQAAGSYAASGANADITSLASPAISAATATTQAASNSSTKVATTAFVRQFKQLAQIITSSTGATASGTTVIPNDNTIPQNTEGTQVLTAAITPTNASSTLEVTVVLQASNAGAAWIMAALFRDAGANAVAVGSGYTAAGNAIYPLVLTYMVSAGSTASTTFNVRLGSNAGTYYINGNSGGQLYGGSLASTITIKEYLP